MKRLALTKDGKLTDCTAPPELMGKGRCNHVMHQDENESTNDFIKRVEITQNLKLRSSQPENKINERSLSEMLRDEEYGDHTYSAYKNLYSYAEYVLHFEQKLIACRTMREERGAEWYREEVQSIDRTRRIKHNSAIASISMLNRIAKMMGLDPVYPGEANDDNREDVAKTIFEYFKDNFDED